jgi:osmotically-inducible protein OsmY
MQDVVQLSGFVDSAQTKARAGEVARSVKGVREVKTTSSFAKKDAGERICG